MGLGRYQAGKFDIVLSVRHNADAACILEWQQSFRRASEILYDATDGQMQFGRVYLANNSRGGAEADCFLMEADGGSFTTPPIPGLGNADLHAVLMGDERRRQPGYPPRLDRCPATSARACECPDRDRADRRRQSRRQRTRWSRASPRRAVASTKNVPAASRRQRVSRRGTLAGAGRAICSAAASPPCSVPRAGLLSARVQIVNSGKARDVGGIRERLLPSDTIARLPEPPAFQRTRRVHVHVGPLPRGIDLEVGLPRPRTTVGRPTRKAKRTRARKGRRR